MHWEGKEREFMIDSFHWPLAICGQQENEQVELHCIKPTHWDCQRLVDMGLSFGSYWVPAYWYKMNIIIRNLASWAEGPVCTLYDFVRGKNEQMTFLVRTLQTEEPMLDNDSVESWTEGLSVNGAAGASRRSWNHCGPRAVNGINVNRWMIATWMRWGQGVLRHMIHWFPLNFRTRGHPFKMELRINVISQ